MTIVDKKEYDLLPTGKPHISFSEISEWKKCSWKHKLVYIDKLGKYETAPALLFGTLLHSACEDFLKTRKFDIERVTQQINEAWDEQIKAETPGFDKESAEQHVKDAAAILQEIPEFMEQTFPGWTLIDAEHYLYEDIEGHNNAFKGFIDGVISCKDKKGKDIVWLIDWKTSNRGWFADKRSDELTKMQLTLYKSFWTKKFNAEPKNVRCAFVILKKQAKSGQHCELFTSSVGPVTEKRSLTLVSSTVVGIKRGVAIKNRDSCRWCEFKDTQHCT